MSVAEKRSACRSDSTKDEVTVTHPSGDTPDHRHEHKHAALKGPACPSGKPVESLDNGAETYTPTGNYDTRTPDHSLKETGVTTYWDASIADSPGKWPPSGYGDEADHRSKVPCPSCISPCNKPR